MFFDFLEEKIGKQNGRNMVGWQGQSVFPSVQSVGLFPRTGRTPYYLPLPGTDPGLQSVLTCARDGRPGPTVFSSDKV